MLRLQEVSMFDTTKSAILQGEPGNQYVSSGCKLQRIKQRRVTEATAGLREGLSLRLANRRTRGAGLTSNFDTWCYLVEVRSNTERLNAGMMISTWPFGH